MTHDERSDVDGHLRRAFVVPDEAVRRTVHGAYRRAGRPIGWLSPSRVLLAGMAAALVIAMVLFRPGRPGEEVPGESVSGWYSDGILTVALPDGSLSISTVAPRDGRPPAGAGLILVEGDEP